MPRLEEEDGASKAGEAAGEKVTVNRTEPSF
jgi:hypothetical protein